MAELSETDRKRVASAVTNYCGHKGEPDAGDALEIWCPDCRRIVHAVFAALGNGSTDTDTLKGAE